MKFHLDFSNPKVAIVNIIIILFLILGTYDGYKKGIFESFFKTLAFILSAYLAFMFKDNLSVIFYKYLPFLTFGGVFKGITALNILLYELLAFIIIFIVLMIIINLILKMTQVIDRLVKHLPLVGFIDHLIGAVFGFIQSILILYLVVFVFKFGCNLFGFGVEPSLADDVMNIPVLKEKFGNSLDAFNDIVQLKADNEELSKEEFNNRAIKVLLDKKVISRDNLDVLIEKKKITYNEE